MIDQELWIVKNDHFQKFSEKPALLEDKTTILKDTVRSLQQKTQNQRLYTLYSSSLPIAS